MKSRLTIKGIIGLLVAVAGAAWLAFGSPTRAPAQTTPQHKPASEQIDVELAVDFPYDI